MNKFTVLYNCQKHSGVSGVVKTSRSETKTETETLRSETKTSWSETKTETRLL